MENFLKKDLHVSIRCANILLWIIMHEEQGMICKGNFFWDKPKKNRFTGVTLM